MTTSMLAESAALAASIAMASLGLGFLGWIAFPLPLGPVFRERILLATLALTLSAPWVVLMQPELSSYLPAKDSPAISSATFENVTLSPVDVAGEFFTRPPDPGSEWPRAANCTVFVWLAGSALFLFQTGFQVTRLLRRLKTLPAPAEESLQRVAECWPDDSAFGIDAVALRCDATVRSPYSFFATRPQLVLPEPWIASLSQKQLTAVLAHELSHLQHRDSWQSLAWRIAAGLYWWNPFIWLLLRQGERQMEYRADENCAGNAEDRIEFARLLISTARSQLTGSTTPSPAQALRNTRPTALRGRIRRLLKAKVTQSFSPRWAGGLALALLAASATWLMGCASVAPAAVLPREEIVTGLSLHGKNGEMDAITARLRRQASQNQQARPDDGSYVAVSISIFEFPRRGQDQASIVAAQVLDKNKAEKLISGFSSQRGTKRTSYPRMLTRQRQTALFRSVVNLPYLADSTTSVAAQGDATEIAEIEYIPVGMTIGVLPTVLENGLFHLAIDLNFSELIGEQMSDDGNAYPVISTNQVSSAFELGAGGAVYLELPPDTSGKSRAVILSPDHTDSPATPGK